MSLVEIPISKDLHAFVENNLHKIMNVDEIINISNFKSLNYEHELQMCTDELYLNMRKMKKIAQLKINSLNSFYDECQLEDFEGLDDFGKDNESFERLSLIESICRYIVFRQAIVNNEKISNLEEEIYDENFDQIGTSLCFYCDHPVDSNEMDCSMCGADINDMKDFAKNRQNVVKVNQDVFDDDSVLDFKFPTEVDKTHHLDNTNHPLQCDNLPVVNVTNCEIDNISYDEDSDLLICRNCDVSIKKDDLIASIKYPSIITDSVDWFIDEKFFRHLCKKSSTGSSQPWFCNKCHHPNCTDLLICDKCRTNLTDDYVIINKTDTICVPSNSISMSIKGSELDLDVNDNHYDSDKSTQRLSISND